LVAGLIEKLHRRGMADGRWQMADGRWQMADGRWQIKKATSTILIVFAALFI